MKNSENGYILREKEMVYVKGELVISNEQVLEAIIFANKSIKELVKQTNEFNINIIELLGMRNLSSLVGEYFVKSLEKHSNNALNVNIHQDGYPDLILINTPEKRKYFDTLYTIVNGKKIPNDKHSFSPFLYGGVEIKATCGTLYLSKDDRKMSFGEQRIRYLGAFDWKAHHRFTNNLIGLLWDFIEETPTIVAAFYSNTLTEQDWGENKSAINKQGHTTNSCTMNRKAVQKMCSGWIAVINDEAYTQKLSKTRWIGYKVNKSI